MENASKALIIAGSILIGILIISIGIYIIRSSMTLSDTYDDKLAQDNINAYNNKFLIYAKDITPQEMVSLYNLVNENNATQTDRQIRLMVDGVVLTLSNSNMINIMKNANVIENGENAIVKPQYKYIKITYKSDGYINQIEYRKI